MTTKAELTKQFILETVAPIFNMHGYVATSLSDITKATGLTKGAIYGNFKNKEELAFAAFKLTLKSLLKRISNHISQSNSPLEKLYLINDFYRNYYDYSKQLGGCPVINMGVDANNQNSLLLSKVREVILKIQNDVASIVKKGIEMGEIKSDVDPIHFAKRLDTMLQGAIFMTYTMDDEFYLKDTVKQLDIIIKNELEK